MTTATNLDLAAAGTWVARPQSRIPAWVRALFKNPTSITGMVLISAFALVAIFAPLIAPPENPENPFRVPRDGFTAEPTAPSPAHPFGTTEGQYDIFYGVVWGTRT